MKKTCAYCGAAFDAKAAKCPKCGRAVKSAPVKAAEPPKKKHHGLLIFFIVFIFIVAVAAAAVIVDLNYMRIPFVDDILTSIGIVDKKQEKEDEVTTEAESETESETETEPYSEPDDEQVTVEFVDPDTIYKHIDEKIAVDSSPDVRTEKEAVKEFAALGFDRYPVTYSYDMDGNLIATATEASSAGTEKHPVYNTFYITESGDYWTLLQINGCMIATPVSYNLNSGDTVKVVLAETDSVTSFSATNNTFYVTSPDETELRVIKVDKIDAQTLESITADDLKG